MMAATAARMRAGMADAMHVRGTPSPAVVDAVRPCGHNRVVGTAAPRKLPHLSFRAFLEDASFCGLDLSPMVAAIVDASEGLPVDLPRDACIGAFGCGPEQLPREPRRTVCVSAGGRGGKSSRLLAPKALHAAWTVP